MDRKQARLKLRPSLLVLSLMAALLAIPAVATAHLERPSYWPDPDAEMVGGVKSGGKVPEPRSLASAATGNGPGRVRVVCKGADGAKSLAAARRSIRSAAAQGFKIRPSQAKIRYSKAKARKMMRLNRAFARDCRFKSIQAAVNASGNNDRVVVMPGLYREKRSRKAPTDDPRCNPRYLQQDASGNSTPSYEYQAKCPNDQNLVYVQGRAVKGEPVPAQEDRQGIPEAELGRCVRCNLQIEGSGAKPTDVILDAGKGYGKRLRNPGARPRGYSKHVVLRVDRGDGFVGRNFLMRGGLEFGFYTEETDGVLLDKTKFFWNADYGHLSFTSDHAEVRNCDGYGSGDSVVYPGAAPETGAQHTGFYPKFRMNTVIHDCDLRGSVLGYSGSMGNAVRITDNHIYGNATGIASDTLSSAGHPGFPADSSRIDHNYIYSNNLDVYRQDTPVEPLVGLPIGTGIIYPGMNSARVHNNYIFDNWRDGAMLFSVPDSLVNGGGPEGEVYSPDKIACETHAPETNNSISTSCGNRFFENQMGRVPPGFKASSAVRKFGNVTTVPQRRRAPNGNDFWWDEFATNDGNCWFENTGPDGTKASVTGPGDAGTLPGSQPQLLPNCTGPEGPGTAPQTSVGSGDANKEAYLLDCSEGPDNNTSDPCDWWFRPPRPGRGTGGG